MSYRVEVLPQGFSFTVATGETLLQAARRQGYRSPASCTNAICYICEAELIQGQVIHQLQTQLPSEQALLTCVAEAQTDLIVRWPGLTKEDQLVVKRYACQVMEINTLAEDIFQIELMLPAGETVEYFAGQYLQICLTAMEGAEEVTEKVPFSIANAPLEPRRLELHIQSYPDNSSNQALLAHLRRQSLVQVEMPQGRCFIQPQQLTESHPWVLMAFGVGFSQIKAMAELLLNGPTQGAVHCYWSARNFDDFYALELLQQWRSQYPNFTYQLLVQQAPDRPTDLAYRVTDLASALLEDFTRLDDLQAYICGSPNAVYEVLDALVAKGFNKQQMHSDVFDYAPRG